MGSLAAALTSTQFMTFLLGLAGVIGASVAVCLGHIDAQTYVALVGPLVGAGVGAGIHASGQSSAPAPAVVTLQHAAAPPAGPPQ